MVRRFPISWSSVLAGQVDAGLSAASGFAAGVYAARTLDPAALGAYGVLFALFGVLSQFPTQLLLTPAEAQAAQVNSIDRLSLLKSSLSKGAIVATLSALVMPIGLLQLSSVSERSLIPLIVTAAWLTAVSPLQDHVRKMFHLAARSWAATRISGVQLVAVLSAIFVFSGVEPSWVVFGAPAFGNTVSIVAGLLIVRGQKTTVVPAVTRELLTVGRSLIVTGVAAAAGFYLSVSVVQQLGGLEAVGFYEAARVVARPLQVVGFGLLVVVGPALMTAIAKGDLVKSIQLRKAYWSVTAAAGLAYLAIASVPLGRDALSALVPNAFVVTGLVTVAILENMAWSAANPIPYELIAMGRQRSVATTELGAQVLRIALAPLALLVGAFALPIGSIVGGVAKVIAGHRIVGRARHVSTSATVESVS
jgi:O-antigen/teichoic acid export membrane protein